MNAILKTITVLPYITQSSSIAGVAPSICAIGLINMIPMTVVIIPHITVKYTSIVKYCDALFLSPSPSVLATSALPPAPIIKPKPPRIIMNGITRLIAANDTFPAKLDTKKPSTTPYIDVNTIIITDGRQNLNSLP